MVLHVYNSLHRKKEEFESLHKSHVGMYVCGPTVYDHCHIGHGKSYISFDVICRYLRYLGYKVRYVQNITDVGHLTEDTEEDKVVKQSRLENLEPMELVERYTRSFFEDMDALNVLRPDISPRASAHIPEQIEVVEKLLEKGYAYESKGSVYFSIEAFPDYGKLSGRNVEDQLEASRVDLDPDKRDSRDFLLWRRASEDHILKWRSPWGMGYPGWHIECSAMSMRYIGETLDIHGGGRENQFPHHDCEIAQSEALTGKTFVRYWIHNNMVTVNGQKMGKSLGNSIYLKDAFKQYDPQVIRFAILRTHYRSIMDYSEEALHAARSGYNRLKTVVCALKSRIMSDQEGKPGSEMTGCMQNARERFLAAIDDDFNTPMALASVFDLTTEINNLLSGSKQLNQSDWSYALAFYNELVSGILGIDFSEKETFSDSIEPKLVELVIGLRKELRSQKNWELADKLRDDLKGLGIVLKDEKDGTCSYRKVLPNDIE